MNLDTAKETFFVEAGELLDDMEQALLALEQQGESEELINRIVRAAHTIKGSSGLFGLDAITRFTHGMEGMLDALRKHVVPLSRRLTDTLLQSRDHLDLLLRAALEGRDLTEAERAEGERLGGRLREETGHEKSSVTHAPQPTRQRGRWGIEWRLSPDLMTHGLDPLALLRYLKQKGDINAVKVEGALPQLDQMEARRCYLSLGIEYETVLELQELQQAFEFFADQSSLSIAPLRGTIAVSPAPSDIPGEPGEGERPSAAPVPANGDGAGERAAARGTSVTLRVDANKLDRLINLVGELVIAGASAQLLARQIGNDQLLESNSTMSRLVEDIRDTALTLRMVQIGETFTRFQRVVRDVSRDLAKEVALVVEGGETELDKTVVEKIADPLMHIVRNALDHGIEPPDERQRCGKPRIGALRLGAFHDSGNIVIEVTDDGRGIDVDRLVAKGREAGLVGAKQQPTREEAFRLAFEPGISTATKVTDLSGRGVGLDVVKRNIEALRGSVQLDSQVGSGTRITIRLPLTLAIIDGFRIGVGGASYVIPLDAVIECVDFQAETTAQQASRFINLRGEVLPFLRLREVFEERPGDEARQNVVVVSCGGQKAGLVVDELFGEHQTVIKPLGRLFDRTRGLSGATILGSGEVAMVLDVPQLIQRATCATHDRMAAAAHG